MVVNIGTDSFHCETLQNLPKFGFLLLNKPSGNPSCRGKMLGGGGSVLQNFLGVESVFYVDTIEIIHLEVE
jgi:hypothetical protein